MQGIEEPPARDVPFSEELREPFRIIDQDVRAERNDLAESVIRRQSDTLTTLQPLIIRGADCPFTFDVLRDPLELGDADRGL